MYVIFRMTSSTTVAAASLDLASPRTDRRSEWKALLDKQKSFSFPFNVVVPHDKKKLFCSARWHLSYCCLLRNSQSSSLQCFFFHEYQKQNSKDEMSTFCKRGRKVAGVWRLNETIHDKWNPLNVTNYILLWTWLGLGQIDKKWTLYTLKATNWRNLLVFLSLWNLSLPFRITIFSLHSESCWSSERTRAGH